MDGFLPTTRTFAPRNAWWLGQLAALAYQPPGFVAGTLRAWGFTGIDCFDQGGTQAFLAWDATSLFVAFRGTEPGQLVDWMTDLDVSLVGGPAGKVHEGFAAALGMIWRPLLRAILQHRERRSLWLTGHSLGATLATLATAKLRLERDEPVNGLYTFGQPRTGDREFARVFDADFGPQTFRYVNNNDIVPRVPFRSMSYSHVGMLRYIDVDGVVHADELLWWEKLLDRVRGRLEDVLVPGTDGMKDHAMARYLRWLEEGAAREATL